ncbi:MAG: M14 family metallopeptidase [Candidatus Eisenbacteria bacterium]
MDPTEARLPLECRGPHRPGRTRPKERGPSPRGRIGRDRPIEACRWRLGGPVAGPAGSPTPRRPVDRGAPWSTDAPSTDSQSGPHLFLLSLIHPMEWIGREIHLALLRDLLDGEIDVPAGTVVTSLLDANPDGTARVEAALRSGQAAWTRGNARGVDLNRNFPRAFRTRPRWIDFWPMWRPGPGPASEPETRAVLKAAGEHPTLVLSLHSFGRWIFYPPAHARTIDEVAESHQRIASRALAEASADGYRHRTLGRYARWFRAYGTEIDAFLPSHASPRSHAFLVELSWGGFGRWGLRRLLDPFFTFNPPDPASEYTRVGPALRRIIELGLRDAG